MQDGNKTVENKTVEQELSTDDGIDRRGMGTVDLLPCRSRLGLGRGGAGGLNFLVKVTCCVL